MPYNLFDKFRTTCREYPEKVHTEHDALEGARRYKLNTEKELLKFIGNGGLMGPQHIGEDVWRYNPDPDKANNPLYVNDYKCDIPGRPSCYIAVIYISVFFGQTRDKWKIKSFKQYNPHMKKPQIGPPAQLLTNLEDE
jgi:hypothetical protein